MAEQTPPPGEITEEDTDTAEILAQAYYNWKRDHPDGSWSTFWQAVRDGEVTVGDD
jgi:hypothetical protein